MLYILHYNLNPDIAEPSHINAKENEKKERQVRKAKKRKGIEARRAKPSTPTQAVDAHRGGERRT